MRELYKDTVNGEAFADLLMSICSTNQTIQQKGQGHEITPFCPHKLIDCYPWTSRGPARMFITGTF